MKVLIALQLHVSVVVFVDQVRYARDVVVLH